MTKLDFTTERDPGGDVLKLVYQRILHWKQENRTTSTENLGRETVKVAGKREALSEPHVQIIYQGG